MKPDWWGAYERLKPKLEKAMGPEGYTAGWLEPRLLDGRAQLWLGERSALITEVDVWTIAAAGDQREIIDALRPQAEAWATAKGFSQSIVDGRAGWRRALLPHGYVPFNDGVRKELN